MKIDKIIFSCSSSLEYGPFWDVQAKLWSNMGIEPWCLVWRRPGDDAVKFSTDNGQVREFQVDQRWPWILQLTWSKFIFPADNHSDSTWMIGDIDLLPLQKRWFTTNIESISPNALAHLNVGGIASPRLGMPLGFFERGPQILAQGPPGTDVPGHYHVAKGSTFGRVFKCGLSLEDHVEHMTSSHRYGLGPCEKQPRSNAESNPYWYYWCAEENYSSVLIWSAMKQGLVFEGRCYNNSNNCDRINRDCYNHAVEDYVYDTRKLADGQFVDIHCARPYAKQEAALMRILKTSSML